MMIFLEIKRKSNKHKMIKDEMCNEKLEICSFSIIINNSFRFIVQYHSNLKHLLQIELLKYVIILIYINKIN